MCHPASSAEQRSEEHRANCVRVPAGELAVSGEGN